MRVAIIGGTGFVGHYITEQLLAADMQPVLLVRPGSENKIYKPDQVEVVSGDIDGHAAVKKLMHKADAAIYLIGILREFPGKGITFEKQQFEGAKTAIDTAAAEGVHRFLLMSANGAKAGGTAYQDTKYRAEEHLKTTSMEWTIFRPSVLFGDPHGRMEFATQLTDELIKPPIPAPLFFDGMNVMSAGHFEMAPTDVKDVAQAFVKALQSDAAIGKTLPLCGPENVSWKRILQILAQTVGNKKLMVPAPAWGIKSAATFLDRYAFFPISRDQVTMLLEGNTCEGDNGYRVLDIEPTAFTVDALAYLKQG
ncbi:MAG: NAD(P)H-binding protein [bacterium]